MNRDVFEQLLRQQLISGEELAAVRQWQHRPLSVHWELRTLLYLGILLVTAALGILVYEHLDSIGHTVIVTAIGLVCGACFAWCFKKAAEYSFTKIESPGILYDYILLFGCLLLLCFVGYLQFAYNLFGHRWGLAVFIPMVILFFAAYYFDHLGVLSLAITHLAAWAGITITPAHILRNNDFSSDRLIYTGILLGVLLLLVAWLSTRRNLKAHFAFTYQNFGVHILFISLLAGMLNHAHNYLLWFVALAAVAVVIFRESVRQRSFYFLVVTVLYTYVGLSFAVVKLLFGWDNGMSSIYLGLLYAIASGIVLIRFLMQYNKKLKQDAGI